jgi:GNAT superfamily N-acetyltransferase
MQLEGLFDVPPSPESSERWDVSLPLDERSWNIGLIVGPSGCGKSTVAREVFGDAVVTGHDWPEHQSVVDGFPVGMSIKDITGLLSSVGFSSPPAWLRPFHVLSTGQQFRVTVARALAEPRDLVVIDEFTSVVDRTVAQIGSAAVAKAVRGSGRRFVAVACHYDIIDWLQPDWLYEPATNTFQWRCLQRRPPICLTVRLVSSDAWNLFKKYHYMSAEHHPGARCFVFLLGDDPVAFLSVIHYPGAHSCWRAHRAVVLPDYGGAGIGSKLAETVAPWFAATGKPFFAITAHPALTRHHARSPLWSMTRKPSMVKSRNSDGEIRGKNGYERMGERMATNRITATFRYAGPSDPDGARELGLLLDPVQKAARTADFQHRAAQQRARRAAKGGR